MSLEDRFDQFISITRKAPTSLSIILPFNIVTGESYTNYYTNTDQEHKDTFNRYNYVDEDEPSDQNDDDEKENEENDEDPDINVTLDDVNKYDLDNGYNDNNDGGKDDNYASNSVFTTVAKDLSDLVNGTTSDIDNAAKDMVATQEALKRDAKEQQPKLNEE